MSAFSRLALFAATLATPWVLLGGQDRSGLAPIDPGDSLLLRTGEERAEKWRERLLDPDLDRREQHFERLIEAVRRNPDLRGPVEAWAADAARPELAWTARLALRELARQPAWGFRIGPLSRGFGPTHPWFSDPLGGSGGSGRPPGWPGPEDTAASSSESFSLSLGPGGARLEVTREVDGQSVTETFEEESLEALLEAHPELREKMPWGRAGFGLGRLPWQGGSGQEAVVDPTPVRTDVLGVVVRELGPEERARLGLEEGLGLRIDRVAEGTIAASLGLRAGYVLVELNGRGLRVADDVSGALAERGPGGEVTVVLLDREGRRRPRTWRPAGGAVLGGELGGE